jgi:RNase P/RNase MRP subunit POP5
MKDERQRYILFKILNENNSLLNEKSLLNSLWHSIWRYFGMKEASKVGLWLVELNNLEGYGIFRCSHITKEIVITALTMIQEVSGQKVIFSPFKTAGTLNKIRQYIK